VTKATNIRLTPEWLLDLVRETFDGSIDIDPCTEENNPTNASAWYTLERPAPKPWPEGNTWCNPPWSHGEIIKWARTAMTCGNPVLVMTPADIRTTWFKYLGSEADYQIQLTRAVKCYAPELERSVEPSRGVLLWTRHISSEALRPFRREGHLVLPLNRI
jgi:hypothetical protein